jgi:ADP-heptose:LPS heptosyltransferase
MGYRFESPTPAEKPNLKNPMGVKQGRWIGFAPFSAHTGKTYPMDMSEELIKLLSERYDRVFIHSGGGEEAAFAERMEAQYSNVTALWSRLPMSQERDLISHLDCVVTMDSFVMHLASLVATPTVSVWGATHPEFGFLGYGLGDEGVLQVEMPCRPCSVYGNKPCKKGGYACIKSITPQMIIDKVEELLA